MNNNKLSAVFTVFMLACLLSPYSRATNYWFDTNQATDDYGVTDGGSYNWQGTDFWNTNSAGGAGTYVTWDSSANPQPDDSGFVNNLGSATGFTVNLGASDDQSINIGDLGLNWNLTTAGALGAGNVTIGGNGGTGALVTKATGIQLGSASGTLTINSAFKFGSFSYGATFRGGDVVINGVVSDENPANPGGTPFSFTGGNGLTSGTLTLANTANTYVGRTNTQWVSSNYVLAVAKLADGGQASSIGVSSANIGLNGGTLRFIGTGAQSTNLGFHLASGGGKVDASGATASDTITYSGAITYNTANSGRIITLTGDNTGNNTLASQYGNNGTGINALIKSGAGTWVLTGNNSYTGTTTVNEGSLIINGDQSLATGNVSIATGATLGGVGTIGGATTVNGFLSPGNSPGILNIDNNLTLTGTSTAIFEGGDTVIVSGILDLQEAWTLQLDGELWQSGGSTILFTYDTITGSHDLTPTFLDNTGLGGNLSLSLSGNNVVLDGYSVVPEPSACAMILGSACVLLLLRRRRI